jgi:hypothetical protein
MIALDERSRARNFEVASDRQKGSGASSNIVPSSPVRPDVTWNSEAQDVSCFYLVPFSELISQFRRRISRVRKRESWIFGAIESRRLKKPQADDD